MMDQYYKQKKMYNPTADKQPSIHIYGAGSIGSHVTIGVAKTGFTDITVYDYDTIEDGNKPAQFYDTESKGMKLENIQRITRQMTGTEISTVQGMIDESFQPVPSTGSIHVLAFDNIEARKILLQKLKGFPVIIIDGRIGGFNYEKYTITDTNNTRHYETTLEGNFSEEECGNKCLWAVNMIIASNIIMDIVKISKEKEVYYILKGSALAPITINKKEQ